jgi:Tfp pilus assembly protein PilO
MAMLTLQKQITWCTRAQWTLGAVIVALTGGFYLFGYRPITQRQAQLQVQIAARQFELSDTGSKAHVLPQVATEVKILRLKLEGSKRLPKQNDLAQFMRDITQLSSQSSLKNFHVKPDEATRTELYSSMPIKLTFEGDFVNVFSFLRQTETMQRLTRTRSISLTSKGDDDKSGTVKAELSMNIYFSADE